MAITLKSQREVELMRQAGTVVHRVLARLEEVAAPGVTTGELDAEARRLTRELGAEGLFKGVQMPGCGGPFPGYICASLNEQVVHGVPSDRKIRDGDLLSIDFGCRLAGYCADAAVTLAIGEVSPPARRLVEATRRALAIAIETARCRMLWSDVAGAMQRYVEGEAFSVVREFVGHGIGRAMHEDPKVPNFVSRDLLARDIVLEEGIVLAVEPMVTMGSPDVTKERNQWPVVTKDGRPAAHFEHTLAMTADGFRVLTDGKE